MSTGLCEGDKSRKIWGGHVIVVPAAPMEDEARDNTRAPCSRESDMENLLGVALGVG
jgi:hypothetical protein